MNIFIQNVRLYKLSAQSNKRQKLLEHDKKRIDNINGSLGY